MIDDAWCNRLIPSSNKINDFQMQLKRINEVINKLEIKVEMMPRPEVIEW
jgi:hypothetical protein